MRPSRRLILSAVLLSLLAPLSTANSVPETSTSTSTPPHAPPPTSSPTSAPSTGTPLPTSAPITRSPTDHAPTLTTTPGTCEARTIGCLEHLQPRQCLASWTARHPPSEPSGPPIAPSTAHPAPSFHPADPDPDDPSPLDTAPFLSFEEWRKKNLAEAGQSPDRVGHHHHRAAPQQGSGARRRPPGAQAPLDALGEDVEIDLDFGGLEGGEGWDAAAADGGEGEERASAETGNEGGGGEGAADGKAAPPASAPRALPKDAGKTCKERFNYASFDCAATVLKANRECRHTAAVLVENKDSYLLNECAAGNKFLIVELCEDILVDTVVLANFEFFSSMVRTFRVSVSDRYPVRMDRWKELGTFEARNAREIQAFLVEHPLIWARYLRIEFLSHYGNEYYCPLSLVRVHGTTMMEEFRRQEELARGEVGGEDEGEDIMDARSGETVRAEGVPDASLAPVESRKPDAPSAVDSAVEATIERSTTKLERSAGTNTPSEQFSATTNTSVGVAEPQDVGQAEPSVPMPVGNSTVGEGASGSGAVVVPQTKTKESSSNPPSSDSKTGRTAETAKPAKTVETAKTAKTDTSTETWHPPMAPRTRTGSSSTETKETAPREASSSPSTPSSVPTIRSSNPPPNSTKPAPRVPPSPSSSGPPPSPTTQESFFASLHKRLQSLESSSSLSLQYIESQSRMLRDAFAAVEKRQAAQAARARARLDAAAAADRAALRALADQLRRHAQADLASHARELADARAGLARLADELVWQRRLAVVQAALLLACLALVLGVRAGGALLGGADGAGGAWEEARWPPIVREVLGKRGWSRERAVVVGGARGYESPGSPDEGEGMEASSPSPPPSLVRHRPQMGSGDHERVEGSPDPVAAVRSDRLESIVRTESLRSDPGPERRRRVVDGVVVSSESEEEEVVESIEVNGANGMNSAIEVPMIAVDGRALHEDAGSPVRMRSGRPASGDMDPLPSKRPRPSEPRDDSDGYSDIFRSPPFDDGG